MFLYFFHQKKNKNKIFFILNWLYSFAHLEKEIKRTCVPFHTSVWKSENDLWGSVFSFYHTWLGNWNSDGHTSWPVPLSADPSCGPPEFSLSYQISLITTAPIFVSTHGHEEEELPLIWTRRRKLVTYKHTGPSSSYVQTSLQRYI